LRNWGCRGEKDQNGYSTDAQVLETLQASMNHRFHFEYRMISKLYGTYIDGLIDKADASGGSIRPFIKPARPRAGFPAPIPIFRIYRYVPNRADYPARFVPRDAQRLLVSADYSQIELRLLAHMSGTKPLSMRFIKRRGYPCPHCGGGI
jgi:DNA polymerase-1